MIKAYLTTLLATVFCAIGISAQTIYSEPTVLQENSQDVKIYFNAVGTPLEGQRATAKIYAHTGYETEKSEWNAAPSWGNNDEKYLLTNQGENLWMLYIGNIRTYYNVPDGTNVTGLDFVFRAATNSPQTEDLSLPVYADGLQVSLTSNLSSNVITGETSYVTFTVNTTEAANITLAVDGRTIASANNQMGLEYSYTFTDPGEYTVTATATANGETAQETMSITYLAPATEMDYPGGTPQMGPVANADGTSVTFCIGAPEKHHVMIVGSWNDYALDSAQQMNYQDTENGRYFWVTINGLNPEEMYVYYFIIDGGEYIVGDPYARLVLDPYNDKYLDTNVFPDLPDYPTDALDGQNVPVAVYQGTINDYDWQVENFEGPDKNNLIIYELLFRDFTGTEGKALGNGTVQQAIEKFDYLKQLGVNAIELLPICEFNGNNSWGYNPNFYFAVDKAYGTPDDYKEFIDLCHQNGMAVILDMVFNQSDGLHPWYQMYKWKDNPFYNSSYGGDNGAPHAYSVLNDWNQGVPMVQEQFDDVIRYWMTEYKFDGFRFDLVKGLGNNDSYANAGDAATNAYNASRVARMAHFNEVITGINPYGYCINENLAGAKEENEMAADGELNWANVNEASCQYAMGYNSGASLNRFYAVKDGRTWGSTVSYAESHDEQRLAYKQDQWGVDGVKGNHKVSMQRIGSVAAQMIMAPGAHMIWQFSEMGNAQNTKNDNGGNNTSPKVVNWSLLDNIYNHGLYNNYCTLIDVRLNNPEMFAEDIEYFNMNCSRWADGRSIIAKNNGQELFTLVNPNIDVPITMEVEFDNADNDAYQILSASCYSDPSFNAVNGTVTIPANCYVVIGSKTLTPSGIEDLVADSNTSALSAFGGYGVVNVMNAAEKATVYSLDGKVMGSVLNSGSVNVAPGLYVVKSGKESVKVVVK